ncbi:MAG TPA: DUF58 domain-containing protein [Acidimicrobiia bacterium]|jgi:uncharacterized protein (DUF58 family)|nr:DUF58 domain-containing protein [Acidimicrobiia bacterium]
MIDARRQAALRGLELAVLRRLDGILQGDYRGLLPGHGFDAGEARLYQAGDDVRRIDWNVTARTLEPHVRDTIADRELETTLVMDMSASMSFGTAREEKRDTGLAAAGAVGFLVARGGNRIGGIVAGGATPDWIRPRAGRTHLLGLLGKMHAVGREGGRTELEKLLETAERLAKRRGFVAVISDFLDTGPWPQALRGLTSHHDVLAIEIIDPRELELPDVGTITMTDPETGRRRFVHTSSAKMRDGYATAAAQQREDNRHHIRAAGADHLVLRTDRDWVADLIRHVALRRRGQTSGRRP